MSFIQREYEPGDVLFKEGGKGESAYLIKKGEVEISQERQEKKVVLTVLKPVSVFGEMALLLDRHRRTATATILTPASIVEMDKATFDGFVQDSPMFISALLDVLVKRLEKTTQKAARVPDPFRSVTCALNMLTATANPDLPVDAVVGNLSEGLLLEADAVLEVLHALKSAGLVEMEQQARGQAKVRVLRIRDRAHFLDRARALRHKFARGEKL